jgi:hypothetical protein
MIIKIPSLHVAYYAYLLNIFDSFLRLQNSCLFRQKQVFFKSLIMDSTVVQGQSWVTISRYREAAWQGGARVGWG